MSAPTIGDIELCAWLDGEAPPERRDVIEQWFRATPGAAARIERWRRQNEMIRGRFARIAAEPMPETIWAVAGPSGRSGASTAVLLASAGDAPIQIEYVVRPGGHQRGLLAMIVAGSFVAGAASAFIAAAALGYAPSATSGGRAIAARPVDAALIANPMQALAQRAVEANQTYVRDMSQPVEVWADDIARVGSFLSRRVGFAVAPPIFDLAVSDKEAPRLLGGRVAPGDTGPSALLVYEELGGDRFGLLMARAPNQETSLAQIFERRTSAVAVWTARGVAFALVGPKDPARILRLAAALEAKVPAAAAR